MSKNTHFKRFSSQQGWTMWSMMFVIIVLFITAYICMRLVPIYSANSSVVSAMRATLEGKDLSRISRRQVVNDMQKRLYIDGLNELLDYKNDLAVSSEKGKVVLQVEYDREVPLAGNLVLIARFNPKIECELNGRCDP